MVATGKVAANLGGKTERVIGRLRLVGDGRIARRTFAATPPTTTTPAGAVALFAFGAFAAGLGALGEFLLDLFGLTDDWLVVRLRRVFERQVVLGNGRAVAEALRRFRFRRPQAPRRLAAFERMIDAAR